MRTACQAKKPIKAEPIRRQTISSGAPGPAAQAVEHEADADHLAGLERVGEGQEGKSRHAPGGEVVASRDVETDLAPEGQAHHENEDRDQEKPGEVAGGTIEAIENGSDHEGYACLSVLTMTGRTAARKRRRRPSRAASACRCRRPS